MKKTTVFLLWLDISYFIRMFFGYRSGNQHWKQIRITLVCILSPNLKILSKKQSQPSRKIWHQRLTQSQASTGELFKKQKLQGKKLPQPMCSEFLHSSLLTKDSLSPISPKKTTKLSLNIRIKQFSTLHTLLMSSVLIAQRFRLFN